jgi:ABC-type glycerol-3-phosphate transport system substrate-binding protein
VLDTDLAIETTQYWSDILTNYGPPGVSSYHWQEAQQSVAQGFSGNWIDGALLGAKLLDPEFSKVVDDIGYHVIEGVGDKYTVGGGWGLWIPESAPNPRASWEFIKWATSKEIVMRQATENYFASVTRKSVLNSAEFRTLFNDEFVDADVKALSKSIREYSPLIPEGRQIRDLLAIALQETLTGQATAEEAMKRANDAVVALLEESGYYDSLKK